MMTAYQPLPHQTGVKDFVARSQQITLEWKKEDIGGIVKTTNVEDSASNFVFSFPPSSGLVRINMGCNEVMTMASTGPQHHT